MEYPDNLISEESEDRLSWVYYSLKPEDKAGDWLPFNTYDMVQCGYPMQDHGIMVARDFGGTDDEGKVLPPKGMWCKVEDVRPFLEKLDAAEDAMRALASSLAVGGYNSLDFDPNKFYDKISWGIDQFAKDYHQLQLDLAESRLSKK